MADLLTVAMLAVAGLFFAGWAVLLFTSGSLAIRSRRNDPAVVKLYLYRHYRRFPSGLLLLGIGSIGGFLGSMPWLFIFLMGGGPSGTFGLSIWTLAWSLMWASGTCGAFLTLSRIFSLPKQEVGR